MFFSFGVGITDLLDSRIARIGGAERPEKIRVILIPLIRGSDLVLYPSATDSLIPRIGGAERPEEIREIP